MGCTDSGFNVSEGTLLTNVGKVDESLDFLRRTMGLRTLRESLDAARREPTVFPLPCCYGWVCASAQKTSDQPYVAVFGRCM